MFVWEQAAKIHSHTTTTIITPTALPAYLYLTAGRSLCPAALALWPRHPHPAAPAELKDCFSQFLAKLNSSETGSDTSSDPRSSSLDTSVYSEFWEAPSRFWKPRVRQLEEDEMDAVMVSVNTQGYYQELTENLLEWRGLLILIYILSNH